MAKVWKREKLTLVTVVFLSAGGSASLDGVVGLLSGIHGDCWWWKLVDVGCSFSEVDCVDVMVQRNRRELRRPRWEVIYTIDGRALTETRQ